MSELKLVVGEYYYDSEGKVVGPMTFNLESQTLYRFWDGHFFRKENGYATDSGEGLPTIHKHIPKSDSNHPDHAQWLVNTHHTAERKMFDFTTVEWGNYNSPPTKKQKYVEFVEDTLTKLTEVIRRKNEDYSYGDDPFANFNKSKDVGIDPLAGLFLRMQDKQQRIAAFLQRGDLKVEGEGIEDAFMDTIGYSLLALGMLHFDKEESDEVGL